MSAAMLTAIVLLPAPATAATRASATTRNYEVTVLPTLGAPFDASNAAGINNRGWIVGDANTPGSKGLANAHEHATLWRHGTIIDLGTLGGPNSSIGFDARPNNTGLISGNAQTNVVDPLGEGWGLNLSCDATGDPCSGSQYEVRGFAWRDGVMHQLPTLGGNNALAFGGANDSGEIMGTAEAATTEPDCSGFLEWRPVIWGPSYSQIRELPLPPGDTVGGTTAINDRGQVVGGSGQYCGPPAFPAIQHALLWQGGAPTDIGSLGGAFNNIPTAINDHGQVVGWSDLPGEATTHAFLWQNGAMTDLGTLPGDVSSFAYGLNNRGQVVGQSCDANGNCRAFLWQNGVMSDLNTITHIDSPGGPFELANADGINERGEIVGFALDQSTGVGRGWSAIPHGAN